MRRVKKLKNHSFKTIAVKRPTMFRRILFLIALQLVNIARCDDAQAYYELIYPGDNPRRNLNFTELAAYDNYKCETHYVTTSDGYILTLFHIYPNASCTTINPEPVLFLHGLYLDSTDGIIPGPQKANCYLLAENCSDVWLGNVRGNRYGRDHVTLDPGKNPEFWDFTFDDMAQYDLPAIVNFVLNESGKSQLNYLGYSQGMTILVLMCSQRAEYNAKFKYAVALSPAFWLDHATFLPIYVQEALALLSPFSPMGETFAYGCPARQIADIVCGTSNATYPACTSLIFAFYGYNNYTISQATLEVALSCEPSGTSYKNFQRWGQIKNNGFTKYDYGLVENLIRYGSVTPPVFDLRNYTVPSLFVTSPDDNISTPEDLETLMPHLTGCPNCTSCILPQNIIHLDYMYSDVIPTLIAPIYINYFLKGEVKCMW